MVTEFVESILDRLDLLSAIIGLPANIFDQWKQRPLTVVPPHSAVPIRDIRNVNFVLILRGTNALSWRFYPQKARV